MYAISLKHHKGEFHLVSKTKYPNRTDSDSGARLAIPILDGSRFVTSQRQHVTGDQTFGRRLMGLSLGKKTNVRAGLSSSSATALPVKQCSLST